MSVRLCVGPMSKNVVDATLEFVAENPQFPTYFIPSRRQIEHNGGYVNNWSTADFVAYLDEKVPVQRDHAGPKQGSENYIRSLVEDCRAGVALIHLDPWKQHPDVNEAASVTAAMMEVCLNENPQCEFEVGTEEQIRKYSADELYWFLRRLRELTGPSFESIKYAVVQSGTVVRALGNTGNFDKDRSFNMTGVCRQFGLKAKEHNSDYLTPDDFVQRSRCGVDTFNIAPELGVLETSILLQMASPRTKEFFIQLCVESKKWEKWVDKPTAPEELAIICGHYQFGKPEFIEIRNTLPNDFDLVVKKGVKQRLLEINECLL